MKDVKNATMWFTFIDTFKGLSLLVLMKIVNLIKSKFTKRKQLITLMRTLIMVLNETLS